MVIHHPERLGLAAVHPLRGLRNGRSGRPDGTPSFDGDRKQRLQAGPGRHGTPGVGDMRNHARQQSGNYEGFLGKRKPSVERIEWAMTQCGRWVRRHEPVDLFAAPLDELKRMAKLAAQVRKVAYQASAGDRGATDVSQFDLFGE